MPLYGNININLCTSPPTPNPLGLPRRPITSTSPMFPPPPKFLGQIKPWDVHVFVLLLLFMQRAEVVHPMVDCRLRGQAPSWSMTGPWGHWGWGEGLGEEDPPLQGRTSLPQSSKIISFIWCANNMVLPARTIFSSLSWNYFSVRSCHLYDVLI